MATRGERFKSDTQRAAHAKKAPRVARETASKRAQERGRTTKGSVGNHTPHNDAARVAKNSVYELEAGAGAHPSRKSTRRSPGHIKTYSALRIAEVNRMSSPQAREQRRRRGKRG